MIWCKLRYFLNITMTVNNIRRWIMPLYRTHTCNALSRADIGKEVKLAGWIHNKRDHGGVLFIDLRDNFGITQVVVRPESGIMEQANDLHKESVVQFHGLVEVREADTINLKLATGEVELAADKFTLLSECTNLPFNVFPEEQVPEDTRLKYRFLDLRKARLHNNILIRSKVISAIRKKMEGLGFVEFQTPILTASSPEGARDYLVPSRLHPGKFYALPQAPQQYKQLLMASGFDRYFQIAPCFRDEDARATRSPGEFYQLDMEMSFVTQDDVFAVVEDVIHYTFTNFSTNPVTDTPFPRITYADSLLKYGTDKPDLRIPLEIQDVTEIFRDSEFKAFAKIIETGGVVRTIPVRSIEAKPRSFFEGMIEYAQSIGSKGLGYIAWTTEGIKSPISKFLSEAQLKALETECHIQTGDVLFFICHREKEAVRIAADIRVKLGEELGLVEKDCFKMCWVVDFPMYERDETTKQIIFSHNPFSMPQGGMEALETKDPLDILAFQYDLVCNGVELSSGAIRNNEPEIMYKAFEIAGHDRSVIDDNFPAMITAFKLGTPPHGGIAPGIDRIIMLLTGEQNIREVIAFPMNQRAQDLMMNAPREATAKQLKELHLKLNLPESAASSNS